MPPHSIILLIFKSFVEKLIGVSITTKRLSQNEARRRVSSTEIVSVGTL